MKLAMPVFIAAALAVGCKSSADKPAKGTQQDPQSALQLAKAKAATLEAAQAMDDYAYARKSEFIAKMKSDMVATQEELDRLAAKVASSAGAVKTEAAAKLDAAHKKLAQTKQQLEQAENATESSWNEVKKGFKNSYADLKDSVAATRLWLSEKIAP
jgi:gamma-glutamyl:cysteine ligase YbdK (ATP-grasp superfamily)